MRCTSACAAPPAWSCACRALQRPQSCRRTHQWRRWELGPAACCQIAGPLLVCIEQMPPLSPLATALLLQLGGGPLVRLGLQGGASLQARLLVGADGPGSAVRRWSQIRPLPRRGSGAQRALVAATVSTAWPFESSFQRFLPTGPMALLPARGGRGVLLWSCPAEVGWTACCRVGLGSTGHDWAHCGMESNHY